MQPWFMTLGVYHLVEILQTSLFTYLLLYIAIFGATHSLTDMRRFFIFSELAWFSIFILCIISGVITGADSLYAQALFVLIFTACEAIILSSILLLAFEAGTLTSQI